jgi:glutamate-1-semialdehyde 2,1-aminomutase
MSATLPAAPRNIDRDRVNALMERERARLLDRTKRSGEFYDRAKDVMPGGVPSQFQKNDPWPTYLTRG